LLKILKRVSEKLNYVKMKNQNLLTLAVITALFAVCTLSCETDDEQLVSPRENALISHQSNVEFFQIQSEDHASLYPGVNDPQLTKEWWKFVLNHDCSSNPLNYPSLQETEYQSGPVVFLVGSKNDPADRTIVAHSDQTLFVPIFNSLHFEECIRPATKPAVDESVENSLIEEVDHEIDLVTNLKVVLDDQVFRITKEYRSPSGVFTLTGKKELSQCLDYCITGTEQRVASDGYWLTIKNLSQGWHKLHTHGEILHNGIIQDVYYTILVQ
jgi:hypothetical protein